MFPVWISRRVVNVLWKTNFCISSFFLLKIMLLAIEKSWRHQYELMWRGAQWRNLTDIISVR